MRLFILCFLFLLFFAPSAPAYAACASPAGVAGDLIWNETAKRPSYCDGATWRNFWKENQSSNNIQTFGVGGASSCAVKNDGTLFCWGSNVTGGTGRGTTSGNTTTPTQIGTATDWGTVSMFSAALTAVACGLRDNGTIYCWGSNGNGITGQGTTSGNTTAPAQVGTATDWSMVDVGAGQACGLRSSGALYCWGGNGTGGTGLGVTSGNQTTPAQVGSDTNWDLVSTTGYHVCALKSGALYCWGMNSTGATGLGTTSGTQYTPAQVGTATDWSYVYAGTAVTCGIRGGALYCWGDNAYGATGLGTTSGNTTTPTQVGTATDWQHVALGGSHGCGIRSGALYCWGYNAFGSTGLGTTSGNQTTPAQVGTDTDWDYVDAGGYNSCGMRGDARYCWGWNYTYSLGLGDATQRNVPTLGGATWGSYGTVSHGSGGGSGSCTGPDGVAGDIVYNATSHVLQYCDGSGWHGVGPTLASTGGGCANPVGVEGDMVFNTTHSKLQYCNGTGWYHVAPAF